MKNFTFLFCLTLTVSIFACKKSDDAAASHSALPKTYTEDIRASGYNSVTTFSLTYDSKNRIISTAASPEPSLNKFLYQYPDDRTLIMDLYNNGKVSIHETMWLNDLSFLDSTLQVDDTKDTTTEKYLYDPNHRLITVNNYEYQGSSHILSNKTQYTYDDNGNTLTQSDYSGTTSFTYYTDMPYTLSIGLDLIPLPKYFIKTMSSNTSGSLLTATHFYTFDSNKRLIQDSASISGSGVITVKTYTY